MTEKKCEFCGSEIEDHQCMLFLGDRKDAPKITPVDLLRIECQECLISRDQCYRCTVVDQKIPPKLINLNFKEISEYIDECMSGYSNSREPSTDEVIIAWLVCEVKRLQAIILKSEK